MTIILAPSQIRTELVYLTYRAKNSKRVSRARFIIELKNWIEHLEKKQDRVWELDVLGVELDNDPIVKS